MGLPWAFYAGLMLAFFRPASPAFSQTQVLQVAVVGAGTGTVTSDSPIFSCDAACSFAIPSGNTVTLTASPSLGSEFIQWIGDCSGDGPTCSMTMDGTKMAIPYFDTQYDPFTVRHWFLPGYSDGLKPYGDLLPLGGYLYGMTSLGGRADGGTIFRELPDGSGHTVLHDFTRTEGDGSWTYGSLTYAGGKLYGMTSDGGSFDQGTLFEISSDGGGFKVLHTFTGFSGDGNPLFGLLIESNGWLYGMANQGGDNFQGVIFKISLDGADFQIIHSFAAGTGDGQNPYGSLLLSGGMLYGMTSSGGASGGGTLFRLNPDGSGYQLLHSFAGTPSDGAVPCGSLIVSDGLLYGTTAIGGTKGDGTIFKVKPDGSDFQILHSFAGYPVDGHWPEGSLICAGSDLYGMTNSGGASDYGTVFKLGMDGNAYQILHSFGSGAGEGHYPYGSLVISNGTLYGMTHQGGADDQGTIFNINLDGSGYCVNHIFASNAASSRWALGSLIVSNGMFHGMTVGGGIADQGTIFKINPDGTGMQVQHYFGGYPVDGSWPQGSLLALDDTLYGMTSGGGTGGMGTLFEMNSNGSGYQRLHSFLGGSGDGDYPFGSLIASADKIVGMSQTGGITNNGIIFQIGPDGNGFQLLHSFAGYPDDGAAPYGSLLSGDGMVYGLTNAGSAIGWGSIFKMAPDGNGYQLLHSFNGYPEDGNGPNGSLVESGGMLYGMTYYGGIIDSGVIFKIAPGGDAYQVIHSFEFGDGINPNDSLIEFDGILYGMTQYGGPHEQGTIFQIDPDGSNFRLLHSFQGGPSDGTYACGSLSVHADLLYGMTMQGGLNNNGVLFSLRIQPLIAGTVTIGGIGLAGVTLNGLPGNPITDSDGRYSDIIVKGWSGTVTPTLAGYSFTQASVTYSNITSDQLGQDYTATVAASGPPPVKATGEGAAQFGKESENTLNVHYDTSSCSAQNLIILYGRIGSWTDYVGCAQSNGGASGSTTINSAGQTNVWYNLVWADGSIAGHPGYGFDGTHNVARTWTAAGFCGMAADNQTHSACP